jgi:uncharacterized protein involved in cysteine biosynthesis
MINGIPNWVLAIVIGILIGIVVYVIPHWMLAILMAIISGFCYMLYCAAKDTIPGTSQYKAK